jgi:hypothetical protein
MGRYRSIVGEISQFGSVSVYWGQSGASTHGANTTVDFTSCRVLLCSWISCDLFLGLRGSEIRKRHVTGRSTVVATYRLLFLRLGLEELEECEVD